MFMLYTLTECNWDTLELSKPNTLEKFLDKTLPSPQEIQCNKLSNYILLEKYVTLHSWICK